MTRVVFGVTASPFLLQATIRKHLQQYEESDPDLVAVLRRDLYCDDLITSVHSAHEGEELKRRSVEIFSHARMNLRHWTTSRSKAEVEPEGPDHLKRLGEHTDNTKKVILGVSWVPESDQLIFMTEPLASLGAQLAETKRNILMIAARFFDPLGLLAPFSVRAQMMLKELWKNGVGWDQPIPPERGKEVGRLAARTAAYRPCNRTSLLRTVGQPAIPTACFLRCESTCLRSSSLY